MDPLRSLVAVATLPAREALVALLAARRVLLHLAAALDAGLLDELATTAREVSGAAAALERTTARLERRLEELAATEGAARRSVPKAAPRVTLETADFGTDPLF